jgi:AraC-like DNA-binding protein
VGGAESRYPPPPMSSPAPEVTLARTVCNRDCLDACGIVATVEKGKVVRIELAHKRRHAQLLRDHFRCANVFGATHDGIVFAARALAFPLVTANRAAFLLGFAEPNSFARAFRSWERTTPLRWRAARG